jgi:carbon-monoxide dehydrogenase medium subunit
MKPAPFTYHDPTTVAEAAALLAAHENARPLAGGQSLLPMMNFRYVMPDHVIDLNGIAALSFIDEADGLIIGAMTRQRDLEFSAIVRQRCPVIQEALLHVGHRQTRNRGTLGGSLCHLDPAAELVAVMTMLDARLHAHSDSDGSREMSMQEFAVGFMTSGLRPDELLTHVTIPPWPEHHGFAYEEFARRHGDFAIAGAGILVDLDARSAIRRIAIALSGIAPCPVRLSDLETALIGETASDSVIAAASAAARGLEAMEDAHVTASYRQHLAGVLCGRALRRAFARAAEGIKADA